MKQLIHSSGPTIVAAFNNVAYAIMSEAAQSEKDHDISTRIMELLPDAVCPANSSTEESSKSQNKDDKGLSAAMIEQKEMNTIQAVTSRWVEEGRKLLFAVSRYDKSLAIYSISGDEIGIKASNQKSQGPEEGVLKFNPTIIHRTNKRSCSLAFASIPSEDKNKKPVIVIVAGDLNGDATAYSVETGEENGIEKDKRLWRRVLLGHTASVLTSIEIVTNSKGSKILTSDRDEKVRVSSFPQTFNVEGYLLGHSSYVSDVKIVRNNLMASKCITCGGDGTMRIFDYDNCEQVVVVHVPVQNHGKTNDMGDKTLPSPVRLAINNKGTIVAVMYDSSNIIQLFAIVINSDGTTSLDLLQDIECQNCPLGIIFGLDDSIYILTTEPKLVRLSSDEDRGYILVEDQISIMVNEVVQSQRTKMPTSLLEKDKNSGKLKLIKKVNEGKDGFTKNEPWLKRERVEIYKAGVQRRKQRKFEKKREVSDN